MFRTVLVDMDRVMSPASDDSVPEFPDIRAHQTSPSDTQHTSPRHTSPENTSPASSSEGENKTKLVSTETVLQSLIRFSWL